MCVCALTRRKIEAETGKNMEEIKGSERGGREVLRQTEREREFYYSCECLSGCQQMQLPFQHSFNICQKEKKTAERHLHF